MTKLTSGNNFSGQLDNCYIIVDGVFVVLIVDNAGPWCDRQWPTFWYINSISTQYDFVSASTATNVYY